MSGTGNHESGGADSRDVAPAASSPRGQPTGFRTQRSRSRVWTAGTLPGALALTRVQGLEPVAYVLGSSVVRPGWAVTTGLRSGELDGPYKALAGAYATALARLRREAAASGADGVTDVRLTADQGPLRRRDALVVRAVGTAVRGAPGLGSNGAFVTSLAGGELLALRAAGYEPVDLCVGVAVLYLYTDWQSQSEERMAENTEVRRLTAAAAQARRTAMERTLAQARAAAADGLLDCRQSVHVAVVARPRDPLGGDRTDHLMQCTAVGQAVRRARTSPGPLHPARALPLSDSSPSATVVGEPAPMPIRLRFRAPDPLGRR